MFGVPSEDHYTIPSDPSHFCKALVSTRPMMNRQNRESGIEGLVPERQAIGRSLYGLRRHSRALPNHFRRWLDSDHEATVGFIRSRARTYVENTSGRSEGTVDLPCDSFVRPAVLRVRSEERRVGKRGEAVGGRRVQQ